jgi:hypothetical protein
MLRTRYPQAPDVIPSLSVYFLGALIGASVVIVAALGWATVNAVMMH